MRPLPLIVTLMVVLMALSSEARANVEELVRQARSDAPYRAPTDAAAEQWRAAFRDLLNGDPASVLALDMEAVETPGALVIREAGARTGRGVYALRKTVTAPLLVQAPHQFADLHTGTILARMVDEGLVPAAAFNTVHRRAEGGDAADMTVAETSVLRSFTLAHADLYPHARVVQLHGYATEKRSGSAAKADVVLSSGIPGGSPEVDFTAGCLKRDLGLSVLVYGRDSRELGGTRNVVGRALRAAGTPFVHIEMNLPLRERLRDDAVLRAAFAACLSE